MLVRNRCLTNSESLKHIAEGTTDLTGAAAGVDLLWMYLLRTGLFVAMAYLAACSTTTNPSSCHPLLDQSSRQEIKVLVERYWEENYGKQQSTNFAETFVVKNVEACGAKTVVVYEPKAGILGSRREFAVDRSTGKVEERSPSD